MVANLIAIPSQVFLLSFITLSEKRFLCEETVSTSALQSNTRNQDSEYIFSVLFSLLCTKKQAQKQTHSQIHLDRICSLQTPQSLPTLHGLSFSLVKSPKGLHQYEMLFLFRFKAKNSILQFELHCNGVEGVLFYQFILTLHWLVM